MPKGTRVSECVEKLKGKRGVNAYAVCQAATGQSYATGRKIKGRKSLRNPKVHCSKLFAGRCSCDHCKGGK